MCSSILWMLALTGPNSTTCLQIREMKRPSEVPPVVESSVRDAALLADRLRQRVAQLAGRGEERLAAERPGDVVVDVVPRDDRLDPRAQRLRRRLGAEAEVEVDHDLARDDVAGAGAGVDVRHLPGGRREVLVAAVPLDGDQLGQRRRGEVDRVPRQLRIGDVALHALDAELAGERAAAAVLDRVAEARAPKSARRRCSSRAACRARPASSQTRAVPSTDGPFLVAGDEQGDAPRCVGGRRRTPRPRRPSPRSRSSCRRRRGRTACRREGRHERVAGPGRERAGRDDVGVAGEDEQLAGGRRPRRIAHRLLTRAASGPNGSEVQAKPSGARRAAISAWQPPSSGVTERQAISCSARSRRRRHRAGGRGRELRSGAGSARRRRLPRAARRS